ncbi:cbb3-type cytochrome c oxidase subunit 3 [Pontivivens nitratireducens]|uniref:cbb3-type cytochrome c oxidase subunit 3 n=1 Tax=Pontivivens nitratireducens TaxID=2758038 RepID=UPI00163B0C5C|nr:cbb3-type cytochrome c oxidase subunit 3 [Pontibrevibacter nitratireducens]
METYSFLRQLADSWVLLVLTLIFLGVVAWAFRPGSRGMHNDAAAVPFRHDDAQLPRHNDPRTKGDGND